MEDVNTPQRHICTLGTEDKKLHIDLNKIYGQEVCRAVNQLAQVLRDRNQTLTAFEIDGKRIPMLYIPEERLTKV